MLAQYFLVFAIARTCGAGILGEYSLAYALLQLTLVFALLGLDNLLVREIAASSAKAERKSPFSAFFRISLFSSVLTAFVVFIGAEKLAGEIFHKPFLAAPFRYVACCLPLAVSTAMVASGFRGMKNMTGFLAFKVVLALFTAGFVVIGNLSGQILHPTQALLIAYALVALAALLIWRAYGFHASGKESAFRTTGDIIKQSFPMMLTGSVFFVLGWTDNVVLGVFRSTAEVGIYDTAFKIAGASSIILMAVNSIQAPVFSLYHAQGEKEKLRNYIHQSNKLIFYATLPVMAVVLFFPERLLGLFGETFSQAALPLRILALSTFVSCISGSVGNLLQMTGNQAGYNRIILIAASLGIGLCFLLVPRYGMTGAALASAFSRVFQNIYSVVYVKQKLGFSAIYLPFIPSLSQKAVRHES